MFYYFPFILSLSTAAVIYNDELQIIPFDFKSLEDYYKYTTAEKVTIRLYYECLCPDCRSFDTGPLYKVYTKIGPYLDLHTYPYGNAQMVKEDGKVTVTCQHGEEECYGNKLHGCAIDIVGNVTASFFFNSCMMQGKKSERGSTDKDADYCGQQMNIDSEPIKQCAKSDKGEQLLEYYGHETEKINKTYVPWVYINDKVYDDNDDFMKTVCDAFKSPPPECSCK